MRVRLLIDVMLDDDKVPQLAEFIAEQPTTNLTIESKRGLGKMFFLGRFMGATPVQINPDIEGYQKPKAKASATV